MALIRHDIEALEDSPIVDVWRMGYGKPEIIGMFAGEPDVPTPDFICDAAARAMTEGKTFYTPNRGIAPLREALIDYLRHALRRRAAGGPDHPDRLRHERRDADRPGDGGTGRQCGGDHAVLAEHHAGDADLRRRDSRSADDCRATTAGRSTWTTVFAACDGRTKVIYLASPGNPTGWMIGRDAGGGNCWPSPGPAASPSCPTRSITALVYDGSPVAFSFLRDRPPGRSRSSWSTASPRRGR